MIINEHIVTIILQGTFETIILASVSCFFGILLGVFLAYFLFGKSAINEFIIKMFCILTQSLPEMLILFFIYFGGSAIISNIFWSEFEMSSFLAGTITLSLIFGSYATKIFFTAYLKIQKGELEISHLMGMSKFQTYFFIIWPQVWRYAIPGLSSLWLILLKDTTLISLIGGFDLMSRTQILIHHTQKPFIFYSLISIIYLALTIISEKIIKKYHNRSNEMIYAQGIKCLKN